jgi:hypothetical protein
MLTDGSLCPICKDNRVKMIGNRKGLEYILECIQCRHMWEFCTCQPTLAASMREIIRISNGK